MTTEAAAATSVSRTVAAPPKAKARRRSLTPYALLAPTVVFLAIFFAWPMIQALVLAFQDSSGAWSLAPVQRMTGDLRFGEAIKLTFIFAGVVIPLQTLLALGMALLLASGLRGAGAFLYVWAIPLG